MQPAHNSACKVMSFVYSELNINMLLDRALFNRAHVALQLSEISYLLTNMKFVVKNEDKNFSLYHFFVHHIYICV